MRRSIVILLCVVGGCAFGNEACQGALRDLQAKVEETGTLPGFVYHYPDAIKMGQWIPAGVPFFADPNAVYIGVANSRLMGPHHYYIVAANLRMDGRVGDKPLTHFVIDKSTSMSAGVIFKLKVDKATKEKLEASLKAMKEETSITCLHAAACALGKTGITVAKPGEEGKPVAGANFALSLIEGHVYLDGKKIDVEKLATSKDDLKHFLKEAGNIDEAMKKRLLEEQAQKEAQKDQG